MHAPTTPKHLLRTSDLDTSQIKAILHKAKAYKDMRHREILKDKTIITIFFENSTRTLSSFEIAAKRLGADVVRLDVSRSSTTKGESMSDTAANLNAMRPNAIIIRHKNAGAGYYLKSHVSCPIINGGDGAHAHPTQALLDLLTLTEHFGNTENLHGKKIAIVGDIKNSRVANSNIELLSRFGMEVILVAPPHFLPPTTLRTSHSLREIAKEVDVFMSLRTQTERHDKQIYGSLKDYASQYCLTPEILGDRAVVVLHPGPVHRNIDIDDELLKDPRCKVLEQVTNGVCMRMAVLEYCIN